MCDWSNISEKYGMFYNELIQENIFYMKQLFSPKKWEIDMIW